MPITTGVISGGLSGALNQLVVFKRYGNKTVVTRYPNMSGIKPSTEQKKQRGLFAEAVAYAKIINDNPELKAQYKKKRLKDDKPYSTTRLRNICVTRRYVTMGNPENSQR